jgi:hypothetical protein
MNVLSICRGLYDTNIHRRTGSGRAICDNRTSGVRILLLILLSNKSSDREIREPNNNFIEKARDNNFLVINRERNNRKTGGDGNRKKTGGHGTERRQGRRKETDSGGEAQHLGKESNLQN